MEWINKPDANGDGVSPMNQCKKKGCPTYGCYSRCSNVCPDFCLIWVCPRD